MDTIELFDEKGRVEKFTLLDSFGVDDDLYVVMLPENKGDQDIVFLKVDFDEDDNAWFSSIDDQDLYEDVVDIYYQLKKEEKN